MAQKNIHRKILIQPTAKHMTKSKNVKKVVDSNGVGNTIIRPDINVIFKNKEGKYIISI